jgi:hypothetical protein
MGSLAEGMCTWRVMLLPDGIILRRPQQCSCNVTSENFVTPFVFIQPIIGLAAFGNLSNPFVYVMAFKLPVEKFAIAVGYPGVVKFQISRLWPF